MLKFIIISIAFMYFFPRVLRWGLKLFISNQFDKVQKDFTAKAKPKQKEGEININFDKKKNSSENIKGGEYIDYEEVKD